MSNISGPLKPTVNAEVRKINEYIKHIDNQIIRKTEAHMKDVSTLKNLRAQAEITIQTLQGSLINLDKLQHMKNTINDAK